MYSSLHNHTMYSLLDGYGTPKEMLEQCRKVGIKAYAVMATNIHGYISINYLKNILILN